MNDGKATVSKILNAWSQLCVRWSPWRINALRNYRYVIGDQIDPEVRKQLQEAKRPALVYNLMQPLILFLAGTLSANRERMKATPLRPGDEEKANLHTVLVADWAMEQCDGYYEISKASMDSVITGIGWLNNYWTMRGNPEGKPVTESFNPLMVMFDADAQKLDGSDWRYYTVSGMYGSDEILTIYAKYLSQETKEKIREAAASLEGTFKSITGPKSWLDRVWQGVSDLVGSFMGVREGDRQRGLINELVDARNGMYRVIEWHDRRVVTKRFVYSVMTRESIEIPEAIWNDTVNREAWIAQKMATLPMARIEEMDVEQLWITACAPGLLPDEVLMEEPYAVQGKGWQHKAIFCYDWHRDLTLAQGVVNALIDPQDSYNQRRMSFLEWIMDAVNPDYIYPEGSIGPEQMPNWLSKERGVHKSYKPLGEGMKPERESPLGEASALQKFAEEDADLTQKIAGITPNMLATQESSGESGTLFNARVKQGMVMMQHLLAHIQRGQKSAFNYLDGVIQEFMTLERMVRLFDEEGNPYWIQLNMQTIEGVKNDVTQGEFDFRPDPTQLTETAKQASLAAIIEVMKLLPEQLRDYSALLDALDNPIAKKMKQYAQAMMGMQVQASQLQQSADLQNADLNMQQKIQEMQQSKMMAMQQAASRLA